MLRLVKNKSSPLSGTLCFGGGIVGGGRVIAWGVVSIGNRLMCRIFCCWVDASESILMMRRRLDIELDAEFSRKLCGCGGALVSLTVVLTRAISFYVAGAVVNRQR